MGKKTNNLLKVRASSFVGVVLMLFGGYYVYQVLGNHRRNRGIGSRKSVSPRLTERRKSDRVTGTSADLAETDAGGVVVYKMKPRIQSIWEVLDHKRPTSVPELRRHLPLITDRTLRRDMNEMIVKGYVRRKGTTKSTVYFKK